LRFAIKVHGSDLSYTVRPHPERFVPYALEGTGAAAGILAGSSHTAEVLYDTVPDPTLPERTRLGPPCCRLIRLCRRFCRRSLFLVPLPFP
jgi:hypothetical protein